VCITVKEELYVCTGLSCFYRSLANVLQCIFTAMALSRARPRAGPLLRVCCLDKPLSKAERYGHPTFRPFTSSSILPETFVAIVQSFLEYGMQVHTSNANQMLV
jgi:hypothetical protein